MHVFIDESGSCIPTNVHKVSLVAALAIPTSSRDAIFEEFQALKRRFGKPNDEMKGSSLSERQVANVISLLLRYDTLLEARLIDTKQQTVELTQEFKRVQAEGITVDVAAVNQKGLAEEMARLRDIMLGLSDQLFLQVMLMFPLIRRAFETFANYYAQRIPGDLGDWHWTVDAKQDPDKITPSERLWRDLLLPFCNMQSMTLFQWANYSAMDRFTVPVLVDGIERPAFKLREVLSENLRFEDSRNDLGLQLVDIAANALCRAVNGNLEREGWRNLGKLFVRRRDDDGHEDGIPLGVFQMGGGDGYAYQPDFAGRLTALRVTGRAMLFNLPDEPR